MRVNVVVEGASDKGAAEAIVREAGHEIQKIIDKGGKTRLDPLLANYNQAARRTPWIVFRDTDSQCPVELRKSLLLPVGELSPYFHLRLAHSMTEAWLMADTEGFAQHFQVSKGKVTVDPESLPHAKHEILRLCMQSKSRAIREGMTAGNQETGPLYVSMLNDFARNHWSVASASKQSGSLRRAVARITAIA
ncbi:hypothetical protein MUN76_10300 [Leucobacter rhizosphaerae]|uniref:DUF4276 family protein n=1 Tax=Leucobacter rhizosphaerae TaxID=2932245 RepID=A0ABY4FT26_9MICO|nr:hypothetical protein [Leucobacter rhizosphaerae]UOQ59443.1 hypothetical protein MUN76_10300 [Leucobacter rhizosphaerae]